MIPFDKNKLNSVPPILQDYASHLAPANSDSVREIYAQRFEIIKEYAEFCLASYKQIRDEQFKKRGHRIRSVS